MMGICGTYTLDSANGRMLEIVSELLINHDIDWIVWDNEANPLPFVGEDGCWDHPNVKKFKELANSVDAFVLSSPEYHGTMSGVMKNSLDWLSFDQTSGKVFGFISTLGGQANTTTLNHMRVVSRWIHGIAIPEQLVVAKVKNVFDSEGNISDQDLSSRIEKFANSLVTNTQKLRL
jgi:FMN reductase